MYYCPQRKKSRVMDRTNYSTVFPLTWAHACPSSNLSRDIKKNVAVSGTSTLLFIFLSVTDDCLTDWIPRSLMMLLTDIHSSVTDNCPTR